MTGQKDKKGSDSDWTNFERAVDIALKTPAKHKVASRQSEKKPAKEHAHQKAKARV